MALRVFVGVKRVVDYATKIRVKPDGSGVDTGGGVRFSMNPFDEIAVEEAIRLKEAGVASEVVAVSVGSVKTQEIIRVAIGLGADRGIHIEADDDMEPISVAQLLAKLSSKEKPSLWILGKQAIDDDAGQTGQVLSKSPQMLAALLDWPQATSASKVVPKESSLEITRETDDGLERVDVALPAVVTADLRLNEPRFAKLPNIMKAKKKPLEILKPSDLGIELKSHLKTLTTQAPPVRKAGERVADIPALVAALKKEGFVK